MENLASYDNDSLIKKFNDLKKIFDENQDNENVRNTLNDQLGDMMVEIQRRNLNV